MAHPSPLHPVAEPLDGARLLAALQAGGGLLAQASRASPDGFSGFVCLRRHGQGVEVHVWLARGLCRLPDLHAREACSSLSAAAAFLERFDPLSDEWRLPGAQTPSAMGVIGQRTREAWLRDGYAALVGEALAQALRPAP